MIRRGYVCLMTMSAVIALSATAGVAHAQFQRSGLPLPMTAGPVNNLTKADGSAMRTPDDTFRRAPEEAPFAGAISFRHFAHKPGKRALGHYAKALKAVRANRKDEALARFSDAVRVDPEFFEAHLQIGILCIQAETPTIALPHLETALALDSSSQAAQALSAWALLKLGRDAEAELALRRSIQLGPTLPVFEDLLRFAQERRREYSSYASRATP